MTEKIERTQCIRRMNLRKIDGWILYWSWRVLNGTFLVKSRTRFVQCMFVCVRMSWMEYGVGSWLAMREDNIFFFFVRSFWNRASEWVSKWLRSVCLMKGMDKTGPNQWYDDGGDVTMKSMLLYVSRARTLLYVFKCFSMTTSATDSGVRWYAFDEKHSKRRWKWHNWFEPNVFEEKGKWKKKYIAPGPRI